MKIITNNLTKIALAEILELNPQKSNYKFKSNDLLKFNYTEEFELDFSKHKKPLFLDWGRKYQ